MYVGGKERRVEFEERYSQKRLATSNLVVCAAKKSLSRGSDVDKGLAMNFIGTDLADRRLYRFQREDVTFGAETAHGRSAEEARAATYPNGGVRMGIVQSLPHLI